LLTAVLFSSLVWCLITAKRMLTPAADLGGVMSGSSAIVLYLRSFAADTQGYSRRIRLSPWSWLKIPLTHEQRLSTVFTRMGRFVTVGRPGESHPELGGERIYLADDKWKETVLNLMGSASLVIMSVGNTGGLAWELGKAVEVVAPERLLLFLPPPEVSADSTRKELVDSIRTAFPCEIPSDIGNAVFVYFENGWNPRLVGPATAWLQRALAFGTWDSVTDALGCLLRQHSFGMQMPKFWLGNPVFKRVLLVGTLFIWAVMIVVMIAVSR
jgi:hypothetical protein